MPQRFSRTSFIRFLLVISSVMALAGPARAGAYEDLLAAVENGENAVVFDLIRRGMDVNTTDPNGNTLLMIAARTGNLVLLESLLNNRVNLNRRNRHGDTAVMLASMQGHFEIVRRLVDHGAVIDGDGWTPLHYAIFRGATELAQYLLAKGAKVGAIAPNRQSTLILAITQSGMPGMVKLLLDAGADARYADGDGMTARDHAEKLGRAELVAILDSYRLSGQ